MLIFAQKSRVASTLMILILVNLLACAQGGKWDDEEIANVFDGIDISNALAQLEAKGVTPYDFGFQLMGSGHPDKAKEWFVAAGIHLARTGADMEQKSKFVYGLAWMKWITGDASGAIEDAKYILAHKPPPLIQARTFYLLGAVSVDEHAFEDADFNLNAGIKAYGDLKRPGGQYLCASMLAMCAVFEGNFDQVAPWLEKASKYNDLTEKMGFKRWNSGRYYEIQSELRYAQGDYAGALFAARESAGTYREGNDVLLADEVDAKIGFLLLLNGEPKAAADLATKLWEKHHLSRDRGRLLAYNSITLMKLALCANQTNDVMTNENAARAWASSGPGGKALTTLIDWAKDKKKFPCPAWK